MNADGSGQRQITQLGGANFGPSWTPDGKRLIFSSNYKQPRSGNFDLYLVGLDGTGLEQVTTEPTFFASVLETGSHARTFAALISGKIDVAAIDGVTWALLGDRYPDHAQRLRVLEWTTASPALPFITSLNTLDNLVAALRETLEAAANAPSLRSTLRTLRIKSFSIEPIDTYERIVEIEKQAIEGGYPQLA